VKKKVIELLYSWTQGLPGEVKISEAYQMLKRQSIITEDPVYVNKSSVTPLSQRTKSIFDADEEKSKVKYSVSRFYS
jgi:ADP-ribosylation factor-binding protein GGA